MITIDGKPYENIQIFTTDVNAQIESLKSEIATLKNQITSYEVTVLNRDKTIADLNTEVTRLAVLVEQKNIEILLLKKRITELEAGVVTPPPVEPPAPIGDVYFADDFEGSTNTNLLGGWGDWKAKMPFVGSIYFNNSTSNKAYALQDIRKDEKGRSVLHAQILDDDPGVGGTSRAQMTMDLSDNLDILHTSHRMKLHPDIAHLSNYSNSIRWMTLFEIWGARDPNQGGDPAGSSRISLSLFKDTGAGQKLYWNIYHEEMQPNPFVKMWNYDNKTVAIPFGKWFTLDMYVKRGIGTAGQVKVVITEDGGQPVTLFDIKNSTVYRTRTDLRLKQWQIFKLYSSDQIMDFMRNASKEFSVQYNDVKWFKS